jgi:hypothetical protein
VTNNQSSNSKAKITWRKVLVSLSAIIGFTCLLFVIWLIWEVKNFDPLSSETYQPNPTDTYEISIIEGNADIKIPSSATEIYAFTTGFRDIDANVRFVLDAAQLPEFLKGTLCTTEPLKEVSPSDYERPELLPSWWTPNLAKHLEECNIEKEFLPTEHTFQQILVDMTNPNSYIIFVETSHY